MSYARTGRTALITGSTSGIGRACAETLAREGAHVIVSGRNTERGEHTVDKIRAMGGTADFIAADLGNARSATSLAEKTLAVTGSVDILVNNAGIYTFGPTASTTEEAFDAVYDLNVKAPYFLVRALAPPMAARGSGVIINITTGAAHRGAVGAGLYGSSKAALMLLTKGWAAEFGPSGVRVNAISPGPIHTPGTGNDIDHLAASLPARRIGEPHEVASAVAFLASDQAAYIHGAVLPVDGGAIAA
jgi:NAD(P)-dependent dehydrogenase (short-subunit alcohol dehydrogenase family)